MLPLALMTARPVPGRARGHRRVLLGAVEVGEVGVAGGQELAADLTARVGRGMEVEVGRAGRIAATAWANVVTGPDAVKLAAVSVPTIGLGPGVIGRITPPLVPAAPVWIWDALTVPDSPL